jgi:hypothetical protein
VGRFKVDCAHDTDYFENTDGFWRTSPSSLAKYSGRIRASQLVLVGFAVFSCSPASGASFELNADASRYQFASEPPPTRFLAHPDVPDGACGVLHPTHRALDNAASLRAGTTRGHAHEAVLPPAARRSAPQARWFSRARRLRRTRCGQSNYSLVGSGRACPAADLSSRAAAASVVPAASPAQASQVRRDRGPPRPVELVVGLLRGDDHLDAGGLFWGRSTCTKRGKTGQQAGSVRGRKSGKSGGAAGAWRGISHQPSSTAHHAPLPVARRLGAWHTAS